MCNEKFMAVVSSLIVLVLLLSCTEQPATLPAKQSQIKTTLAAQIQLNPLVSRQFTPRVVDAWSLPTIVGTEIIPANQNSHLIGPISQSLVNEQLLQWRITTSLSSSQSTIVEQMTTIKIRDGINGPWQDTAPTDQLNDKTLSFPSYFSSPTGVLYALWQRESLLFFSHKTTANTWSSPTQIATGSWGHMAFDHQGNMLVLWSQPVLNGVSHINSRVYNISSGWINDTASLELIYSTDTNGLPIGVIDVAFHDNAFQVIWSDPTDSSQDRLYHVSLSAVTGWGNKALLDNPSLASGERITQIKVISHAAANELVLVAGITNNETNQHRIAGISKSGSTWLTPVNIDIRPSNTASHTLGYQLAKDATGISIAWVTSEQVDAETYQKVHAREYTLDNGWSKPVDVSPARIAASNDSAVPVIQINDLQIKHGANQTHIAWVETSQSGEELHIASRLLSGEYDMPTLIYRSTEALITLSKIQLIQLDNTLTAIWLESASIVDGTEYRIMSADHQAAGNIITPQPPLTSATPPASDQRPAATWTAPSAIWSKELFATSEAIILGPKLYTSEGVQDAIEFQFGGQFNVLNDDIGATESFFLTGDGAGIYTENSPIIVSGSEDPENVSSAIDMLDGNVYYIWSLSGDLNLAILPAGSDTWSSPSVIVSGGGTPAYAKVDAKGTGGAIVFWVVGTPGDYQYNAVDIEPGGTVGATASMPGTDQYIHDVVATQAGEVYVASLNGDPNDLWANKSISVHRYTEGSWGKAPAISSLDEGQFKGLDLVRSSVQLSPSAAGRVVVMLDAVFRMSIRGYRRNIYSNWINFNTGWDERWNNVDFNLGFDDRIDHGFSMGFARNEAGDMWVIWGEREQDFITGARNRNVFASKYYPSHNDITLGHWGLPDLLSTTITDDIDTTPGIALAADGSAVAVWTAFFDEDAGTQGVWARTYQEGAWAATDDLIAEINGTVDGEVFNPRASITPAGAIHLVWLQSVRGLFIRTYTLMHTQGTF